MIRLLRTACATFLLGLFLCSPFAVAQETGPRPGQIAPGFELKQLDGPQVSLRGLLDKGHVMLVFWEPQCVYCFMHIKELNELQKKYQGRLTIAAINFLGAYEVEIRNYVNDNGVEYMVLADRLKNIDVAEAYKVVGSPTIVLIAPDGKVLSYGYQNPPLEQWLK